MENFGKLGIPIKCILKLKPWLKVRDKVQDVEVVENQHLRLIAPHNNGSSFDSASLIPSAG